MQPVRKTRRSRRNTITLAAVALLVALAAVFLLTRGNQAPGAPAAPDPETEAVQLINIPPEDLTRVEVRASTGESFALVWTKDGPQVEGKPDFPLEPRETDLMVKDLTLLVANGLAGRAETSPENLELLGLGPAAPRATAEYRDGRRMTLVFGNSARTEIPSDYLMLEGDDRVYTVSPETREHFDRALETLHPVPAVNFTPSLLDRAEFTGGGGFTLERAGSGWRLSAPFDYPAEEAAAQRLLDGIAGMRLAVYAGEADGESLERFGFSPDGRAVYFHLAKSVITRYDRDGNPEGETQVPEQTVRFALGGGIGNIGLYVRHDGKIYQASLASMGFLRDLALEGVLSRTPARADISELDSLTARRDGRSVTYEIALVEKILPNNRIETDGQGNPLFEPHVTRDGREEGADAFLRGISKLAGLRALGDLPAGFLPEGPAVAAYTLTGRFGQTEVALFPFDALHYAMRVNGRFFHYTDRLSADAVGL